MAERRMISQKIVDSDAFLDMPQTTQNLYFHLNVRADDEGFVDAPKKIMRAVGSNQNDLEILMAKPYIIMFESGVIVIKHWKLHNTIRKDRMKETLYIEEKSQLVEKLNGSYTTPKPNDNHMTTICQPSIVEYSIDKFSKVKSNKEGDKSPIRKKFVKPIIDELKKYCEEKNYTVDCEAFLLHYESNGWLVGKNKMKSWKASLGTWNKNSFKKQEKQDNFKRGGVNFEL